MNLRFRKLFGAVALSALTLTSTFASTAVTPPDEGMWLPMFLKRLNYSDMQKKGLKLTADELYNINNSSLKDAVVSLGGFCTAEVISPEGLLLTNHHCAFEAIQSHSSVQNDYLGNGFWAMQKSEELPNPNLTVSFLVRMEDVTKEVLPNLASAKNEQERNAAFAKFSRDYTKKLENAEEGITAQIKPFFDGNEFYLFVYQTFRDVRLVGAPPSSVGKFGGDTDNWMWPRHTGDFSLMRVYASPDNKPADYSPSNVPYKPKHYFPISISGVKEGDFAMIMGYPGRTNRYQTSWGVDLDLEISNPTRIEIRDRKLKTMKTFMDADKAVQIKYASKYAQIANYWKYFIGQSQGLKRLKVSDKKRAEEAAFANWVNANADRKAKYGTVLADLENGHKEAKKYRAALMTIQEILGQGSALFDLSLASLGLEAALDNKEAKADDIAKASEQVKAASAEVYKDYDRATEQKLLGVLVKSYLEFTPADQTSPYVTSLGKKYKGDWDKYSAEVFAKSVFADPAKLDAFLKKPSASVLKKDPAFELIKNIYTHFLTNISPKTRAINASMETATRLFIEGTMARQPERKFYPNANSTMRLTYGQVLPYSPKDGVFYKHVTTLDGVIEKEDPTNEEFVVPPYLKELYNKKDFGRYADENGKLVVGFISNTDITGGNSGSPVLNAKGELIGTAFDGNWEAMSGDIAFEPEFQRTISCDIRYVLWTIEKYAKADNLIKEMTIVKDEPQPAQAPTIDLPKIDLGKMMEPAKAKPAAPKAPVKKAPAKAKK